MATYNGERHVREQVLSILGQSRPPDELIVQDDGSTDATSEILGAELGRSDVFSSVIVNERRLGPAGNFSEGIRRATGDVIALADQDDRWRSDKLSTIEATFAEHTGVAAAFSDGQTVDAEGRCLGQSLWEAAGFKGRLRHRWNAGDQLGVLLNRNVVTGATLAFRSQLADLALPVPADAWHDHWLSLFAVISGRMAALPDRLIDYRLHGTNAMGLPPPRLLDQFRDRRERADVRDLELARLRAVRVRLVERHVAVEGVLGRLDEKMRHLEVRAGLDQHFVYRLAPIVREAASGRYHRLGNGVKSILADVVGVR